MKEMFYLEMISKLNLHSENGCHRRFVHSAPVRRRSGRQKKDTNQKIGYLEDFSEEIWSKHKHIFYTPVTMIKNLRREKTEFPYRDPSLCRDSPPYYYPREQTNFLRISSRNTVTPFLITQQRTKTWLSNDKRKDSFSTAIRERLKSERCRRRSGKTDGSRGRLSEKEFESGDEEKEREPNLQAIRRFRVAILCVRVLVRWLKVIIDISDRMTSRTATEQQWYTLYTSHEAQALAFNKALFARERTFAKVPNWAKDILDQNPEERSENDCRRLHALLRGLKSFDKFTEKLQLSMCRAFRYTCVRHGRVILRRGHIGFNFYFIYSGSVFVNLEDRNIDGEKFEKTETVLVRGDAFGELALLQNIRRTASITCRETCEMLVVDKDTFAKVCPKIFEKELDEKEKFLWQLPLFNSKVWTKDMVKRICTEAQIQEYKTNKVIVTDGDEEWIYICMEGKCQIIRRVALDTKHGQKKTSNEKRPSTPLLSDEVLDILGKLKTIHGNKDKTDAESDESDDEISKGRMLESMSLEYRRDGRTKDIVSSLLEQRRRLMKNPDKEDVSKKKDGMSIKGPSTLTSLMAQNMKSPDGKDFVYLNIGVVNSREIFDLFYILYPSRRPVNSTLILVSLGSRMVRLKRKNFFNITSHEALLYAKRLAKKDRYPTEEMLLQSYREKTSWDNYKDKVVKEIVGPHLKKNGRFSNISTDQLNIMKERKEQQTILLSTLQRNTAVANAMKKDEEEDSDSDDGEFEIGLSAPQPIFVLPHQLKRHVTVDPIPSKTGSRRTASESTKPYMRNKSSDVDNTKQGVFTGE